MKLYIPLVAAVMMLVSSCGKKGEPEPVPSADIKRVTLSLIHISEPTRL